MIMPNIKSDLKFIADHISPNASYSDAMYELYVRMKIAQGKQAADEGRIVPHNEVKKKFSKKPEGQSSTGFSPWVNE